MDQVWLFVCGVIGALIAVFVRKQDVTWDIPLWSDTNALSKEKQDLDLAIPATKKDINDVQDALKKEGVREEEQKRLERLEESLRKELNRDQVRQGELEQTIGKRDVQSRVAGFVVYAVIGGVLATLLASRVDIEGIGSNVEPAIKAVPIGFAWTSILSLFGIKSLQDKYEVHIEEAKRDALKEIDAAIERIKNLRAAVPRAGLSAGEQSLTNVETELNLARRKVSEDFDVAKVLARVDAKRVI